MAREFSFWLFLLFPFLSTRISLIFLSIFFFVQLMVLVFIQRPSVPAPRACLVYLGRFLCMSCCVGVLTLLFYYVINRCMMDGTGQVLMVHDKE
ncbi:hypothetical protein BDV19DRAFT_331969 [Aspergillus venezuelensis]